MNIFTGVVAGWVGRRAVEIGGLLGTAAAFYFALPPNQQDIIQRILTGNWQDITLGAVIPFAIYLGSQVMSFRATVRPQVVTTDGKKVALPELAESTQTIVETSADNALARRKRRPNLLQVLCGKRV